MREFHHCQRVCHRVAIVLQAQQPASEFFRKPGHGFEQLMAPAGHGIASPGLDRLQQGGSGGTHLGPLLGFLAEFKQDQLGAVVPWALQESAYTRRNRELLQSRVDHPGSPAPCFGRFYSPTLSLNQTLCHALAARQFPRAGGGHSSRECRQVQIAPVEPGQGLIDCFHQKVFDGLARPSQAGLPTDGGGLQIVHYQVQRVAARYAKVRICDCQGCHQRLESAQLCAQRLLQRKFALPVIECSTCPAQYCRLLRRGPGRIADGLGLEEY